MIPYSTDSNARHPSGNLYAAADHSMMDDKHGKKMREQLKKTLSHLMDAGRAAAPAARYKKIPATHSAKLCFVESNIIQLPNGAKFLCKVFDHQNKEVSLNPKLHENILKIVQRVAMQEEEFKRAATDPKTKFDSLSIQYPGQNCSDTMLTTVINRIAKNYILKNEKPVPQKSMKDQSTNTEVEKAEHLTIRTPDAAPDSIFKFEAAERDRNELDIQPPVPEPENVRASAMVIDETEAEAKAAEKVAEPADVVKEIEPAVVVTVTLPNNSDQDMKLEAEAPAKPPKAASPASEEPSQPDVRINMPWEPRPHILNGLTFPWNYLRS